VALTDVRFRGRSGHRPSNAPSLFLWGNFFRRTAVIN
jgi:hypothetical protein